MYLNTLCKLNTMNICSHLKLILISNCHNCNYELSKFSFECEAAASITTLMKISLIIYLQQATNNL